MKRRDLLFFIIKNVIIRIPLNTLVLEKEELVFF